MKHYFIFALFFPLLISCVSKEITLTRSRLMMGHVPVNVTVKTDPALKEKAIEATEKAYKKAQEIESKISEYQPSSEISCLNQRAGKKSCKISRETFELIKRAVEISQKVDHAFDLRFGSLTQKGREGKISIHSNNSVTLAHPDTRIGVGAIGKGFIIDAMVEVLQKNGFGNILVDGGGDLRALGGPWKVAIQRPGGRPDELTKVFNIRDLSLATSGNYEQEGHIRDPRTGKKIIRDQSVSVFGENLTLADALATAFYVLGEKESQTTLKKFKNMQMIWTDKSGDVRMYGR